VSADSSLGKERRIQPYDQIATLDNQLLTQVTSCHLHPKLSTWFAAVVLVAGRRDFDAPSSQFSAPIQPYEVGGMSNRKVILIANFKSNRKIFVGLPCC